MNPALIRSVSAQRLTKALGDLPAGTYSAVVIGPICIVIHRKAKP
jgi:hypothetical protein